MKLNIFMWFPLGTCGNDDKRKREIMVKERNENLQKIRHSAAHIMADAVKKLYPGVKLGIGPAIEDGFYYDFDFSGIASEGDKSHFLTPDKLPRIEKAMRKIIERKEPFRTRDMNKKEAVAFFKDRGEDFKIEIINGLEGDTVSIYEHGDFSDLCKGPHVENTGEVKAFKLLSVAGAYWKGNENNPMLQRIYGTAFSGKAELEEYLVLREEAQKRDHRKLGRELDLFSFHEKVGAGLVLYHPKGAMLRQIIVDYITKKHVEKGYKLISSPHILRSDIWIQSGHYDYYKENMYIFENDGQEFAVKPMNCPGHILVYSSTIRSYKEFPIRYFELGSVYRHEKSGVLHGLLRVRGFTQDDAHIFCLREQVVSEVGKVIDFVQETLNVFGFREVEIELSTKPEKHIGEDELWEEATSALKNALEKKGLKYDINEGDGAFYGPKIDIKIKDALGRSWQCATVQCDFALPERFNLKYIDQTGTEQRPVVLHRVILGSLERFIGTLIEHYGGDFPLWIAPVQAKIIPISRDHFEHCRKICDDMNKAGIRTEVDLRDEKMQRKIREAEMAKIPYMIVIGSKEIENNEVSLRSRKEGNLGNIGRDAFIEKIEKEINEKL